MTRASHEELQQSIIFLDCSLSFEISLTPFACAGMPADMQREVFLCNLGTLISSIDWFRPNKSWLKQTCPDFFPKWRAKLLPYQFILPLGELS